MARSLKILFASSEVHPFAKTGGLGDISGALPRALHEQGHDVRVIMPKYKSVAECPLGFQSTGLQVVVPVGASLLKGFLFESALPGGTPIYFVGNDAYFGREYLYGENNWDYPDNAERFIFFCRSVLEACQAMDFQPDIIHCNDWHTGLLPAYLKTLYADHKIFAGTRTLFSIHNLGFQGNFHRSALRASHLPEDLYTPEGVEYYGQLSFLKTGLVFADRLNTVSPSYSKEIRTEEFGFGMEGVLTARAKDLSGILNGADYAEWDPASDSSIIKNFSAKSLQGKERCKKHLEKRFHLKLQARTPLICMITRLTNQKGIDLVEDALEELMDKPLAFILLGTGDASYEELFSQLPDRFPGRCGVKIGYDEKLAHEILAGSDILLMPSDYEPCGLTQLHALKYGTVPLAKSVGGLKDTIQEFKIKPASGTGFKFSADGENHLLRAIDKALSVYQNQKSWKRLMETGMAQDFSWQQSASKYISLYKKALGK